MNNRKDEHTITIHDSQSSNLSWILTDQTTLAMVGSFRPDVLFNISLLALL